LYEKTDAKLEASTRLKVEK
jgi:hypothetical protein